MTDLSRRSLLGAGAGAVALALPGSVPGAAMPGAVPLAERVLQHATAIERLLQDAAPENVHLQGVRWQMGHDDFIASGFWVNPGCPYGSGRPALFRPRYRPDWWVLEPPKIA